MVWGGLWRVFTAVKIFYRIARAAKKAAPSRPKTANPLRRKGFAKPR